MRVLLVTVSARGHAIAEALARSAQNPEIIHVCPVRNPGIRRLAKKQLIVDSLMNFPAILEVAKRVKPDFAFIAPDDPIGGGLADELTKIGIPSVAPKKALARIESSKAFARNLLQKHGIDASPKFRIFKSDRALDTSIYRYIDAELRGEYVVKYDGLLGGKGVKVSGEHLATIEEGVAYAKECIEKTGQVVIEEKLHGPEFSLMSFVSGTKVVDMPPVQDHKRAYEGNTGPNTGGMGSYSDANHLLPFLTKEDLARASEINRRTAEALQRECGEPYKGILYGGYMIVRTPTRTPSTIQPLPQGAGGAGRSRIRLIEFNARFGDPEALNVLPLLETDFVAICQAIIEGTLMQDLVRFAHKATVCKYIVPRSYPTSKDERGQIVTFPNPSPSQNTQVYFGDISESEDGTLHLGGSRTAGIVGTGDTLEEAERIVQGFCEKVEGPVRFRSDIGKKALTTGGK